SPAAPAASTGSLAVSLNRAVAVPGVSRAQTGVVVVDLDADSLVYALNPEAALEPASTEKLPVAITALQRLGGGFRTHTDGLGQGTRAGHTWRGDLVLRGDGAAARS